MWTVTFTILDGKGKSGSFALNFDGARTIAQLEAWVNTASIALNPIIAGGVTAISIARSMVVPLILQTAPQDTSDVEERMLTIARSVAGYVTSFSIPAIDEAIVAVGSSDIDQTNAAVIALNAYIETGVDVAGTLVKPSDNRGSGITLITTQTEEFNSSTKR